MLPLTFIDPADYDRIEEDDRLNVIGLDELAPGIPVTVEVNKPNGEHFSFQTTHTFSDDQINWFESGSALNVIRAQTSTNG